MFLASVGWVKTNKISRLSEITFRRPCPIRLPLPASSTTKTASKRKLDSFGTADIPISTSIPTTTSPWHRFAIGQPKTEKASNKPTTARMDGNLSQKNNGNGTFSWKYYKDNVTEQHRKWYHDNFRK